jgi:hypothetical protein
MAVPFQTIFKCFGRLARDPDPFSSKDGQKMYCELAVFYSPGRNWPSVYIEFIVYKEEVADYILSHFRKGDFIYITEATPATTQKKKFGAYKFVCWDVALKEEVDARTKRDVKTAREEVDDGGDD